MGGVVIVLLMFFVEKDKELFCDFFYEEDLRLRLQFFKVVIFFFVYEELDRLRFLIGFSNFFFVNMGGIVVYKIMQKYGFWEGQGLGKYE